MRVGFSGFLLEGGKSGLSTYCLSLLHALRNVDTESAYEVFASESDRSLIAGDVHTSPQWVSRPLPNILWHQWCLPKGYDLIHIPSIRRLPVRKPCKVVVTVHDMAPHVLPGKYGQMRQMYHQMLCHLLPRCDRVITVSQSTKEDILRFTKVPESKIDVIYPGIDHTVFRPKKVQREPFIVYVSRLEHPGKNHLRLIEAFNKLNLPHQLLLVGAPWQGSEKILEKLTPNIHYLGFTTREELVELYSSCDLMVFPSLYEGFGLPVIEAMACGATVACSNTSSLKEIAEGRAHLFDPTNVDSIATAIKEGIDNPIDNTSYAQNFTWEKTARETMQVYAK